MDGEEKLIAVLLVVVCIIGVSLIFVCNLDYSPKGCRDACAPNQVLALTPKECKCYIPGAKP